MTEKEVLQNVFKEHTLTEQELNKLHTHVEEHKYFLNEDIPFTVTWDQAIFSWYDNIYRHVKNYFFTWIVRTAFPNMNTAEFYFQVMDHWHYMKKSDFLQEMYLEDAVKSYVINHAQKKWFGKFFGHFVSY